MGDAAGEPVGFKALVTADRAKISGERGDRDLALGEAAAFVGDGAQLFERQPVAKIARAELGHSLTHR
jgi:hypothetical protein